MTGDTGGGGLELSLNCDIRIMQRGDYLRRLSRGEPRDPDRHRLAAARAGIGRSRALDFLLRSRYVTPRARWSWASSTSLPTTPGPARSRWPSASRGLSPVALTAAKRSVVRGANLPMQEGLRVEAEEWLKTIVTDEAMAAMRDYAAQPFDRRRDWVRDHGAWPEPGSATGS